MYSTCDHNRCANEDRYRTVCTFYVKEEKIEANTIAKSRYQRVTFLNIALRTATTHSPKLLPPCAPNLRRSGDRAREVRDARRKYCIQ